MLLYVFFPIPIQKYILVLGWRPWRLITQKKIVVLITVFTVYIEIDNMDPAEVFKTLSAVANQALLQKRPGQCRCLATSDSQIVNSVPSTK